MKDSYSKQMNFFLSKWKNLFIIAFFSFCLIPGVSFSSSASTKEYYHVYGSGDAFKIKIQVITEKSCISKLEGFLNPEKFIIEGLAEIQAQNTKMNNNEIMGCLHEIVNNYKNYFSDTDFKSNVSLMAPSTYYYLQGDSFYAFIYENQDKLSELSVKLNCYMGNFHSSYSIEQIKEMSGDQCSNHWIETEEEYDAVKEQLINEQDKYQKSQAIWEKNNTKWLIFFDAVKKIPGFSNKEVNLSKIKLYLSLGSKTKIEGDMKKMNLLWKKTFCFNPHKRNTHLHKYYTNTYESLVEEYCEGKWLTKSSFEKIKKDLSFMLSAFEKEAELLVEKSEKSIKEYEAKMIDLNKLPIQAYEMRKLMARFKAYLKNKKENTPNINNFCKIYENEQRRDKEYVDKKLYARAFISEKDWRFASDFGLTEIEQSSIMSYTGNFYSTINPALWQKKLDEKLHIYKNALDQGLDKIPSYTATPVIRYAALPKNALDEHQVGKIVTYDAYTSTSKKTNWVWNGSVRFVIYPGKNGKNIEDISMIAKEEEILFKAGTRFKVLSRKKREENQFDFILAEVDENGNVIATLPEDKKATD